METPNQQNPVVSVIDANVINGGAFDIAAVEDIDTTEIQLRRNGQPMPLFVTMAGPEHPKRKSYAMTKSRRVRKQLAKTGRIEFSDPADEEAEENSLIADCVFAWRGFVFNGQPIPCTRDNVLMLLTDKKRAWLRRSMKEAFDDHEAFIKVSDDA